MECRGPRRRLTKGWRVGRQCQVRGVWGLETTGQLRSGSARACVRTWSVHAPDLLEEQVRAGAQHDHLRHDHDRCTVAPLAHLVLAWRSGHALASGAGRGRSDCLRAVSRATPTTCPLVHGRQEDALASGSVQRATKPCSTQGEKAPLQERWRAGAEMHIQLAG